MEEQLELDRVLEVPWEIPPTLCLARQRPLPTESLLSSAPLPASASRCPNARRLTLAYYRDKNYSRTIIAVSRFWLDPDDFLRQYWSINYFGFSDTEMHTILSKLVKVSLCMRQPSLCCAIGIVAYKETFSLIFIVPCQFGFGKCRIFCISTLPEK